MKAWLCVVVLSVSVYGQSPNIGGIGRQNGQNPSEFFAGGLSVNPRASSAIAGTGLYARRIVDDTFLFTSADAMPDKAGAIETNVMAGVAQKAFHWREIPVYVPIEAGLSYEGSHAGWAWSTGVLLGIKAGEHFYVCPTIRIDKSSVDEHTGVAPIVGILIGWGR